MDVVEVQSLIGVPSKYEEAAVNDHRRSSYSRPGRFAFGLDLLPLIGSDVILIHLPDDEDDGGHASPLSLSFFGDGMRYKVDDPLVAEPALPAEYVQVFPVR